jgi:hypothetical protein
MSLPYILSLGNELDAARVPYLAPVGVTPDRLAAAIDTTGGSLRVGIVWAGQPKHQNDRNRSIALATIARLFDVGGVAWYSVQKGEAAEDQLEQLNIERVERGNQPITALGPLLGSFIDTSHALARLDLVITVDTAVAHLAGAMGIPCWVLLPFNPDWRWQLGRSDTPWYPTVRLFRQATRGDWTSVIDRVADALRESVERRSSGVRLAARAEQLAGRDQPVSSAVMNAV